MGLEKFQGSPPDEAGGGEPRFELPGCFDVGVTFDRPRMGEVDDLVAFLEKAGSGSEGSSS